jgi:hypothetical protein
MRMTRKGPAVKESPAAAVMTPRSAKGAICLDS